MNDGSTDKSDSIIQSRLAELKNKLWRCQYICQIKSGVGAAINAALKEFSGEFLALLDIDDYMMPEAIEKKVKWLQKNPDYAVVRNNGFYVKEQTFFSDGRLFYTDENEPPSEDMFLELIDGVALNWPGSYMIRASVWLKRCPDREIFPSRNGQNMQMLLPSTYHEKTGYIAEPLMRYLVQENSLSHFSNDLNGEKAIAASYKYYEIYQNVINKVCDEEEKSVLNQRAYYSSCRLRMTIASRTHNIKCMHDNYSELCKCGVQTLDDKIACARLCKPLLAISLRVVRKIRTILLK